MRKKLWTTFEDFEPVQQSPLTVFDPLPINTGILDANGKPIIKTMDAVGYIKLRERK